MPANQDGAQYLQLAVGDERLLMPLTQVQIVLQMPALQTVPSESPGFRGILNYHGISVPVYDLSALILQRELSLSLDTPLILCQIDNHSLGLVVSEVHTVLHIQTGDIQNPKASKLPGFVQGIYETSEHTLWVLDLARLVAIDTDNGQSDAREPSR